MLLALTLDDLVSLQDAAQRERIAIIEGANRITYAELDRRIEILARHFESLGIRRGDRIIVHLPTSIDAAVAMFACWRIGAIAVNVNVQWTVDQLKYVAEDSGARIALMDARRAAEVAALESIGSIETVIVRGTAIPQHRRFEPWPGESHTQGKTRRVLDCDLAAILYTSGSTGAPKGVMLTHLNLLLGARSVARYLQMQPDERVLALLPWSFDYGLNQLLSSFLLSATVVVQQVVMPSEIVKTLIAERVTGFAAVPPIWVQVVRYLQSVRVELPHLRYVTNSGGKIPEAILRAMPEVFSGARIYLMYGLTEAFRSTYLPPERFNAKMGSMGQAIPNVETFVIVEGRGIAGPGEEGELVHRGSLISKGYWNKPEATAAKIKPCPELHSIIGNEPVVYSGDRVRLDEDGDLWFLGRADTMIKSMGFRISPTEVEEIIYASGMVQEVVAFGVPDDVAGEVVHVCVANPGEKIDEQALLEHCRSKMPHYMVPRRIHLSPTQIARTASGKIDVPAVVRALKHAVLSLGLFAVLDCYT